MIIGSDDWRGSRKATPDHEARTPWQIVAVVVIVGLALVVLAAISRSL